MRAADKEGRLRHLTRENALAALGLVDEQVARLGEQKEHAVLGVGQHVDYKVLVAVGKVQLLRATKSNLLVSAELVNVHLKDQEEA